MVDIISKKGRNVSEGTLKDIKEKHVSWIDGSGTSITKIDELCKQVGLETADITEFWGARERPRVLEGVGYSLLIFRAPVIKGKGIVTVPVLFYLLKNNNILTYTKTPLDIFTKLKQQLQEAKKTTFSSQSELLRRMLDEINEDFFRETDVLQDQIERLEEKVLKTPDQKVMHDVFHMKKMIIYVHKALVANREAVNALEKGYISRISKQNMGLFKEVYEDTRQLIDHYETQREILTSIIDIHLSALSNRMNAVMKKLTVIASFVLVPTLISGVYGMNFKAMPELSWIYGYPFALGLMVVSIVLMYWYFRRKELL